MYTRHTYLFISREGRERIFRELQEQGMLQQNYEQVLLPEICPPDVGRYACSGPDVSIPGIVRREEGHKRDGLIPVGFSSWQQPDGNKLRIPAFVAPSEIAAVFQPADVLEPLRRGQVKCERTTALCALSSLMEQENRALFSLGVWGSAAVELLTGYFYTREDSDLDILFTPSPASLNSVDAALILRDWMDIVIQSEHEFHVRIDVELSLPNGYGVSLKELFSHGHTVLAKGPADVVLLPKKEIFTLFDVAENEKHPNLVNVIKTTLN
ncbi:Phosphoribosyl-dephospho-CoA transferase [Saezia sanguinis]|uniref:Phosphoribosyl-dephospho-CoA transferase n=1 Tax=Saezia sanguinis TaxID=1965230 RepID=A0A433SH88_9BURK|nr:malonate decarboxylase holo-[acyl-carrier-protein] synthase [Saezia sanguinis]RUS68117.1 Phosphoribosyl-dephospho-CoA transferase [Saezia sanguinis]